MGWAAPSPGSPWCPPPAPHPVIPSSLLPVPAWGWQGGLPAPESPQSPPAAEQRGMGQVSVGAGLSHLLGLRNAWQWLGLLWGWGAAPWAGDRCDAFGTEMGRGSR